jgi:Leucine-rich repeat (LRR) protein
MPGEVYMERSQSDPFFMNECEAYAEAQRKIKECRKKKNQKLDLSSLIRLRVIPPEIAELKDLKELNLYCPGLKIVPNSIGNISSLEKLSLNYNIPELPKWIWNLDNLKTLSVRNNDTKTIPKAIANLKKLKELCIDGHNIASLPSEIGEQLVLSSLALRCPQLKTLPDSFAHLKALRSFRFDECKLAIVPDFVAGWTKLERLEINAGLTSSRPYTALKTIPASIGNLKKLKHFCLMCASITDIPDSLGSCPLEYLELSGNFKTISKSFEKLSKLKILKLYSSKLKTLPDSVGNLSFLNKLCIEGDKLTALPQSFCDLNKLVDLHLDTYSMETLPASFGNLIKLKKVYIFSGKLTSLPDSMGNLKNLTSLHLDIYNVTTIPASFKKLSYVKEQSIKVCKDRKTMLSFDKILATSSRHYRVKLLETYSIKRIESIMHSVASRYNYAEGNLSVTTPEWSERCGFVSSNEKDLLDDILLARRRKLDQKFKWTNENIKRIIKVSDEFIKIWEESFSKVKTIITALYENEQHINSFEKKYDIAINLLPKRLNNEKGKGNDIENYNKLDDQLIVDVKYDPIRKNEDSFRQNIP